LSRKTGTCLGTAEATCLLTHLWSYSSSSSSSSSVGQQQQHQQLFQAKSKRKLPGEQQSRKQLHTIMQNSNMCLNPGLWTGSRQAKQD
jgi:hypothetical protein